MSFQKSKNKKNIIIYGFNEYTEAIIRTIDKEKCKIIACIDHTNIHINEIHYEVTVISGEQLFSKKYKYDYIVNGEIRDFTLFTEMLNKGYVNNNNFFNYIKLLSFKTSISSSEFFGTYNDFINSNKNFEGLITGLSYAQLSIESSALSKTFFNFANPSQDLFYDFEMMKFAYKYPDIKENLKYVIIGLSYYSFEYDLSLSVNSWRSCYYYPIVGSVHNFKDKDNFINEFAFLSELAKSFVYKDHAETVCEILEENFRRLYQNSRTLKYNFEGMDNAGKLKEVELILQDFDKNYPETVNENIKILNDYLEFLTEKKINPIIVVSPSSEIYNLLVSKRIKDKFYQIINNLKKQYSFQFLDYSNSKEFGNGNFTNASHMNFEGAHKFTKMLEADINWSRVPMYSNAQEDVFGQILNLLETVDEAFEYIVLQCDKSQIEEASILFADISKAIEKINKSLSSILSTEMIQKNLLYLTNLQRGIGQVTNAFEVVDLIAIKLALINKVIPNYNLWKKWIEQEGAPLE